MKNELGFDWRTETICCLVVHGNEVSTKQAYRWFEREHPDLLLKRPNWKAKIRQQLQLVGRNHPALRGLWILRAEPIQVVI